MHIFILYSIHPPVHPTDKEKSKLLKQWKHSKKKITKPSLVMWESEDWSERYQKRKKKCQI